MVEHSLSPASLSVSEIVARIRAGRLSAEEVMQCMLQRITDREAVGAWAYTDLDAAIEQARQADRRAAAGLLHGVPIAIKDLFDTADMPTSYGSALYRGYRPPADAACVALSKAAGAIVVGKSATVEFGASRPCNARNPYNLDHTPGGSSSGSAAAVADGQALLATGTQTGGSIIRPAAFCGVVGFKPTYGRLSPAGIRSYCWSLDTAGLFARTVEDAALYFAALLGAPRPLALPVSSPSLAVFSEFGSDRVADYVKEAIGTVIDRCRSAGAHVSSIVLPTGFSASLDAQRTISRYEMARSMSFEWMERRAELSPELDAEISEGWNTPQDAYQAAQSLSVSLRTAFGPLLDGTVMLTFAAPGEAPFGLDDTGDATFCRPWTLMGLPCVSLPIGCGPNGLPIAVQLVGAMGCDEELLGAALWVEDVIKPTL